MTKTANKSEKELLKEISNKLDQIIAVLATQGKSVDIQIEILHGFGWKWDEVGKFVGLTGLAAQKRHSRKENN